MTKIKILSKIKRSIQKSKIKKVIVFPEGEEDRIIKASKKIIMKRYARPILLGNEKKIKKKLGIIFSRKVQIIDPIKSPKRWNYADKFFKLLKKKDRKMTLKKSLNLLKNPLHFGLMMVKNKDAEGLICGAVTHTAEVLKTSFKIVGYKHKVIGVCLLQAKKKTYFFADCGVNIDPDANDLANIAINSAEFAKKLNIKPQVAMLSFSTHGSAHHPLVVKIRKATKIAKRKNPRLKIDGEIQLDAAVIPKVMKIKCPKSKLEGKANVLIFPNLNAGNIGYKLTERLGSARSIGPILIGMKAPVNDLSRGCSVEDIVDLTLVTAFQAKEK